MLAMGRGARATRHTSKPIACGPAGTALRASGKDGPQIISSKGKRWTDAAERIFLDQLGASCNVTAAAARCGFSTVAIYRRRNRDPVFRRHWDEALQQGYARLEMMLVAGADAALSGIADPDTPFAEMSVREAIIILQLNRAAVRNDGVTRHPGWQGRPRTLDEVRDSILAKLEAFERVRHKCFPAPSARNGGGVRRAQSIGGLMSTTERRPRMTTPPDGSAQAPASAHARPHRPSRRAPRQPTRRRARPARA